jgi:hypothetical protein
MVVGAQQLFVSYLLVELSKATTAVDVDIKVTAAMEVDVSSRTRHLDALQGNTKSHSA